MCDLCAKGFFDYEFNSADIDKISNFNEIASKFTYLCTSKFIKYNLTDTDHLLLKSKFYDKGKSGMYFCIFGSCQPLSQVQSRCLKAPQLCQDQQFYSSRLAIRLIEKSSSWNTTKNLDEHKFPIKLVDRESTKAKAFGSHFGRFMDLYIVSFLSKWWIFIICMQNGSHIEFSGYKLICIRFK